MTAEPITLRVLTDAGLALEEGATSIIAPGEAGYLGILRNHAPLVTTLKPGKLLWRRQGGALQTRLIGEGLLEITQNRCTIFTQHLSAVGQPA